MRTTLNIADDVLEQAKSIAHTRQLSVGDVLSDLARRGLEAQVEIRISPITGLPVIHSPGARVFTMEDYERIQEQIDQEDFDKAMGPW